MGLIAETLEKIRKIVYNRIKRILNASSSIQSGFLSHSNLSDMNLCVCIEEVLLIIWCANTDKKAFSFMFASIERLFEFVNSFLKTFYNKKLPPYICTLVVKIQNQTAIADNLVNLSLHKLLYINNFKCRYI